ncbi:DUF6084 family protein [Pseudonocardia endophytica]|uniref:Uncharacterized protein n=1 Tax=Pseudonocardia endophytica TaxID=401976 RepID=A0A4R1HRC4_PSEEN|nr:DUF6084 family protein [Pseudonocardia endophytica]TCK22329.1 hypothetical protein EV378_6330 [Pseudonocardia endophytica]
MTGTVTFTCTGSRAEAYSAAPSLTLDLRIEDGTGRRVHAIALRVQIRIDPRGRRYTDSETARLTDLFGEPHRWGETLNPLQLTTVPVMVPSFTGAITVPVAVPLSYDLDVASGRYFTGLDGGHVPLVLLFSGTLFYAGDAGVQVGLVSWQEEAHHRLPVAVWRDAMDAHFPDAGWVRLRRDVLDRLVAYRSAHAVTWDDAVDRLLKEAGA